MCLPGEHVDGIVAPLAGCISGSPQDSRADRGRRPEGLRRDPHGVTRLSAVPSLSRVSISIQPWRGFPGTLKLAATDEVSMALPLGGTPETILLVESRPVLRKLVQGILEDAALRKNLTSAAPSAIW